MLSYEGDRVARIEEKFVGLARNENQLQVDLQTREITNSLNREISPLLGLHIAN